MSVIDKVLAAVTPAESEEARRQARERARSSAAPGDWLQVVLEHHLQIEAGFTLVLEATTEAQRLAALKDLAIVLTGHANAEESVLYPALVRAEERGHAMSGYSEQAAVKIQLAQLENLPPSSQEFLARLGQLRNAVAHHMYEEEGRWFLELKSKLPAAEQTGLAGRYLEEFDRYVAAEEDLRLYEQMQVLATRGGNGRTARAR